MNTQKNTILCGFMGCGKSTVGRKLAAISGRKFIDMDTYIEEKAGMTVSEIFAQMGETAFREMEEQAAIELSEKTELVIAAGGGTVLRENSRNALARTGCIFLLDVPLYVLRERLKGDTTRPLLQRPDKDEAMKTLYEERMPKYFSAAHIVIPADAPADVVVKRILAAAEK